MAEQNVPSLQVKPSELDGVLLIQPPTNFEDFRGEYVEIYNRSLFQEAGIANDFVQDDISVSKQHVLRGHTRRRLNHEVGLMSFRVFLSAGREQ